MSNNSSETENSSEFSMEVIKEGLMNIRKGSFGRWKRIFMRLTGNGVLTEIPDRKRSKFIEIILREAEVSNGEGLTGKSMTVSIISKHGQIFLKFRTADDFNSWFHLILSYTKRNSLNSFELTDDGVVIANIKGQIISANSAAVEMFGFDDKSELLGKSVELLMPPSVAKVHSIYMNRYENGGTPRLVGKQREVLGRRKDGTDFPMLIALGELTSSDSRNFIATIKDLSRSKISKSKADSIVSNIQSNIQAVIEEQASRYQSIVNETVSKEIHKVVMQAQKAKSELHEAEEEIIALTKKNNQNSTLIHTFKSLCDEPHSIFHISHIVDDISRYIDSSGEAETLFRTDSVITRHLTLYAMLHGMPFLEHILCPFVSSLNSQRKSFEINPTRVQNNEVIQKRLLRLKTETSNLLSSIFSSLPYLSLEICQITNRLYEKTKGKFSGYEHSICGGFLFLRFICPAIISPESFGLCHPEPCDLTRRNLILISKYVQCVANGNVVEEGNPMFPLVEEMTLHIDRMKEFIESVVMKARGSF